ncbi:hypothetical protein B9Z19DRAFT_1197577 [Tuber borchii]|uniref:Uncharacterized protein n=1 Tax=Tuber borchii TaxID=42251 RepID=A0A2T6ZA96_TUBBO|nr:hypothetical protein B9Z19DRAFT_1197577 [Tuber borchii]
MKHFLWGTAGQWSLAAGRGATLEKDRTGPLNAVHRRPPPGRTDCPVENTEEPSLGSNPFNNSLKLRLQLELLLKQLGGNKLDDSDRCVQEWQPKMVY